MESQIHIRWIDLRLLIQVLFSFLGVEDLFWISGTDMGSESKFYWMGHDRPVTFTDWHAGEPNNLGWTQDCIVLKSLAANGLYKWDDAWCTMSYFFICEEGKASNSSSGGSGKFQIECGYLDFKVNFRFWTNVFWGSSVSIAIFNHIYRIFKGKVFHTPFVYFLLFVIVNTTYHTHQFNYTILGSEITFMQNRKSGKGQKYMIFPQKLKLFAMIFNWILKLDEKFRVDPMNEIQFKKWFSFFF